MLLEQNIKIKCGSNKKKYESKGYIYTNKGDEFEVNIKDLSLKSHSLIKYKCDYCNEIYEISYISYNRYENKSQIIKKDCCKKCTPLKRKEVFKIKYGVEHVLQNKNIQNKMKKTNLERYGVEYAYQNKDIQEKQKKTMLFKYGVEHNMQLSETKDKIKETNLQRYGVNCFLQSKEILEKVKQNNIKKYGVECALQSKEVLNKIKYNNINKYGTEYVTQNKEEMKKILKKINKTMYKNGNTISSRQQRYLCNLLDGELNYPVDYYFLDIAFLNEKIYIEYDGSGHDLRIKFGYDKNKFILYEIQRKNYLESLGWKVIKIKSKKDKLPIDKEIILLINKCINYLVGSNHTWIELNIDNFQLICNEYTENINLELRSIKKEK